MLIKPLSAYFAKKRARFDEFSWILKTNFGIWCKWFSINTIVGSINNKRLMWPHFSRNGIACWNLTVRNKSVFLRYSICQHNWFISQSKRISWTCLWNNNGATPLTIVIEILYYSILMHFDVKWYFNRITCSLKTLSLYDIWYFDPTKLVCIYLFVCQTRIHKFWNHFFPFEINTIENI